MSPQVYSWLTLLAIAFGPWLLAVPYVVWLARLRPSTDAENKRDMLNFEHRWRLYVFLVKLGVIK